MRTDTQQGGDNGRLEKGRTPKSTAYTKLDNKHSTQNLHVVSSAPPTVCHEALRWSQMGRGVFPLQPHRKTPLQGSAGFKQATQNQAQIREWFEGGGSQYNVGLATGGGLVVIDVDMKNGVDGEAVLQALEGIHGKLPDTHTVSTPSGGLHYYYGYPVNEAIRCSAGRWGRGVDIRGEGGYVVAPPSVLKGGGHEGVYAAHAGTGDIAPLPDTWLALLTLDAPPEAHKAQAARGESIPARLITEALVDDLREALPFIPNEGYDLWLKIGAALWTLGEVGMDLFDAWSQNAHNYDPAAIEAKSADYQRNGARCSYKTVFYEARQRGWENPRVPAKFNHHRMAQAVALPLYPVLAFDVTRHQWYTHAGEVWSVAEDLTARGMIRREIAPLKPDFSAGFVEGCMSLLQDSLVQTEWAGAGEAGRHLLPMRGGVLNMESQQLEPYGDRRFTWQLPHAYPEDAGGAEDAEIPTVMAWLRQVTEGNTDKMLVLIGFLCLALVGGAHVQKYLELIGPGGTGKSTFIRLAALLVGEDNAVSTELSQLSGNRFESSGLLGKRLVMITDAPRNVDSVELLKAMVGQDKLRAERKHKDSFSFTFEGVVMIAANEAIQTKDYTSGLSRRRVPVILNYRATEADKARYPGGVLAAMAQEIPGLIRYLLKHREAFVGYLRNPPESSKREKLEAELDTNPLLQWAHESLVYRAEQKDGAPNSGLYRHYAAWCDQNGHRELALNRFVGLLLDNLTSRGIATAQGRWKSYRYFEGVFLRSPPTVSTESDPLSVGEDSAPRLFDHLLASDPE